MGRGGTGRDGTRGREERGEALQERGVPPGAGLEEAPSRRGREEARRGRGRRGRAARDAAELPIAMGGGCRARAPPAALRLLVAHAMLLCAAGSAAAAGTGTRGRATGGDPEAVPGRGGSCYRECGTRSACGARRGGGARICATGGGRGEVGAPGAVSRSGLGAGSRPSPLLVPGPG